MVENLHSFGKNMQGQIKLINQIYVQLLVLVIWYNFFFYKTQFIINDHDLSYHNHNYYTSTNAL